jgi:hypothetical protein
MELGRASAQHDSCPVRIIASMMVTLVQIVATPPARHARPPPVRRARRAAMAWHGRADE